MSTAVETELIGAVDVARDALVSDGETPGEHLAATLEGESAVAHYFEANLPGYVGWQWCVVVAGAPGSDEVTVSEVVLLPGEGALLAPEWLPWSERIKTGDLGAGDLLAAPADDPRLVPNQIDTQDVDPIDRDQVAQVSTELGFGRKRLLSYGGRLDAAQRWYDGEYGPESAMARSARHTCGTCGFYLPLAGALHGAFGACANEFSADGHVVSAEYGCGAHSDVPEPAGGQGSPAYDAYDDGALEMVKVTKAPAPSVAAVETTSTEILAVDVAEVPAERETSVRKAVSRDDVSVTTS